MCAEPGARSRRRDAKESALEPDSPAADESATLQSRLEVADDAGADGAAAVPYAGGEPPINDPVALLQHLDVSGHFHRDSRLGRVFHPGMVSLRENVATDSLHVSVDDNRVTAHVDGVSPLAVESEAAYSPRRAVAHNLAGMAQDLVSLLRGRQGDHRCELNCEWLPSGAPTSPDQADLLDPTASAWSVQLEARVAGQLDEARLRGALRAALGKSPARDLLQVVDCHGDDDLGAARARLQSTPVTVSEDPPLRVCLAHHPAGDVLMLNLNHAAADGVGALRVLQAVAGAYAGGAEHGAPLDFLAIRGPAPCRPGCAPAPGERSSATDPRVPRPAVRPRPRGPSGGCPRPRCGGCRSVRPRAARRARGETRGRCGCRGERAR